MSANRRSEVEESLALIRAPNESVDPAEIAAMAMTEDLIGLIGTIKLAELKV